ncbi:WD40 repeat-like-containing domain protein [Cordyceps fumosorosea ARSEF 2679]|uniref:WD40 repeat-like-containing domain protein n=1 Tax=Cordyceps fumosorosea (strain ARSEF 2679) TaxID=1081104 RepID=A0A162LQJ5_CORFA|nr:WD40 repeat-like-containing domain protein [Cordyceps fumosorosea ARSEF 2679]OAA74144.1 WD40 repeat-like-containing domain protein [Cordyceps fumosorosea ARSEF 2679]
MDRPEPGLIKWTANPHLDSFVQVNLQSRHVQIYEANGFARNGRFDYVRRVRHDEFPPLTTYDWSPCDPGLIAVGTSGGVVNLLRVDDGSNAFVELGLKMARNCHAVAFNTTGLLAVGLDRVRMDQSLHVWDISRLSLIEPPMRGFPPDAHDHVDNIAHLEPSVSVSSLKFFEDSPHTLVAGIKSHGVRIHDLRDPNPAVTFHTRCNNNIAIDYADQNYFASSSLDHPGVMIWDRRASNRPLASTSYVQTVEEDDMPWGAALRLDHAIETDHDPSAVDERHSMIRSLRYCRNQRGLLAILSRTGELRVLDTKKDSPSPSITTEQGPELLHVERSHELDQSFRYNSRKNDRIVSFDWVTLGSPDLNPRLLVLRTSGKFDILEKPSASTQHAYKLIPWQSPHRGLESGQSYQDIMQFDPKQGMEVLAATLVDQALHDVPIFGADKIAVKQGIEEALKNQDSSSVIVERVNEINAPLPEAFYASKTIAGKLRSVRNYIKDLETKIPSTVGRSRVPNELSLATNSVESCREFHEALLSATVKTSGLPSEAQSVVDHAMLFRAKEKYLFDPTVNRQIVSDDPWKRYVWDWVADAELAAYDNSLVLSGVDLSYLGVHAIWTNDLANKPGRNPKTRTSPGTTNLPDALQWERFIGPYCKKRRFPRFDTVFTKRPHTRQLCLEICGWGDPESNDPKGFERDPSPDYPTAIHTMTACRSLFHGDVRHAIAILKRASAAHPELLFVSLALQLMERGGGKQLAKEQLDFDDAVASKTDPYLRAISTLIATGNWSLVADQRSLPLADRAYVAVRHFHDDELTSWLDEQVERAIAEGDVEAIVLTGVSDTLVDVFAAYVEKFHDYQTATLVLSLCYPRYIDDFRCRAWRNAYRALLQRHRFFLQRTKFEVESTKRSKRDGSNPLIKPPSRQIALRCIYCDAETSLANHHHHHRASSGGGGVGGGPPPPPPPSSGMESRNPLLATSINAGVSCPNCGRHLPRCVVCLEVVGVPRSDRPEERDETRMAGRFPTFCMRCEHVLHLDHARQWFARHVECPVPECRCRCNFRANPELNYH